MWNPFKKKVSLPPEVPAAPEPDPPFFVLVKQGTANGTIQWHYTFDDPQKDSLIAHLFDETNYSCVWLWEMSAAGRWRITFHNLGSTNDDMTHNFLEISEQSFIDEIRMQAGARAQVAQVERVAIEAARQQALLQQLTGIVAGTQAAPGLAEVEQGEEPPPLPGEIEEEMTTGPLVDDGKFDW
jgi:hypothetical protein